jgi:HK97 family phage major capsid protein
VDNIIALKQERTAKIAEMQAIHDKAEAESRDLNAAESRKFDRIDAEVRRISANVDRQESLRNLSQPGGRSEMRGSGLAGGSHRFGGASDREVRDLEFNTMLAGELRDLASGTTGFGGMFPIDYQPYVWDRLAPHAVALKTNPTVITTDKHSITLPALTADAAAAWVAENGAISETDPTAQTITVTPTKVAALTKFSREAADDSNPEVAALVMQNLARSIGLAIDLGFYYGSGSSNQPTGLASTAGITTQFMGTNGAAPTNLDFLLTALSTLEQNNADMSKAVIVLHARTMNELFQLKDTQNRYLLESVSAGGQTVRSIEGVPIFTSNQFPLNETRGTGTTCSSAFAYDASQCLFVKAHDVRLEATKDAYFSNDQIGIRCIGRVGIAVPNPLAVVRVAGIL